MSAKRVKRAALYVRVSTDKQTVANQTAALAAVAEARGWQIVEAYSDAGISGSKGRKDRPGLDKLLADASRGKFDVVMSWAIDRIGRSLVDLLDTIQTLEACGVDLYLDQQAVDTTTPAGKLLFQMTGAFAEFERSLIKQRVHAGLKRAREAGVQLGRPEVAEDDPRMAKARTFLAKGTGILKTAQAVGLGTSTVHRLKREMELEAN